MKKITLSSIFGTILICFGLASCNDRDSVSTPSSSDSDQRTTDNSTLTDAEKKEKDSEVDKRPMKIFSCSEVRGSLVSDSAGKYRACSAIHDLRNPNFAKASRPSDHMMCLGGQRVYIRFDADLLEVLKAKMSDGGDTLEQVCVEASGGTVQGYEGMILNASAIEFDVTK